MVPSQDSNPRPGNRKSVALPTAQPRHVMFNLFVFICVVTIIINNICAFASNLCRRQGRAETVESWTVIIWRVFSYFTVGYCVFDSTQSKHVPLTTLVFINRKISCSCAVNVFNNTLVSVQSVNSAAYCTCYNLASLACFVFACFLILTFWLFANERGLPIRRGTARAHVQFKSCKMLHKCSTDCIWKGLRPVHDLEGHSRSLLLLPFARPYTIPVSFPL